MKSVSTKKLLFSAIVLPIFFSGAAMAQVKKSEAYLVDDRAVPARNSTNLCWHTNDWTPAKAIYECEPDLVPQKVVVASLPPPAPAPAPASSRMHFSADELFDFDKAVLKHSPSRDQLDEFAARLKTLKFDTVNVIGHTDRIGSEAYNKRLSLHRAEAVKNYLVTQGVDAGKIRTEGKGKADPISGDKCKGSKATKALIACLQPDRRVEVMVDGTRATK
ncbi:MAG: OmpA family protein [Nitrosomonadaceae bacterium]|nr:OmpA family protein [Nitrosomonadaceae bacterium]